MKKFFVIMSAVAGLTSCTKQLSAPQGAAGQSLFFQNANVAVENMAAKPTAANTVDINFTTVFQNNISRIELMSSATTNTFCTAQSVELTGNSSVKKNYAFTDENVKGSTMYYLLRFKDNNGNWTYSSYITVQVK